ncbi:YhbY family RNA-binding protein, partial [Candidatus Bathyarchaeota archaeon]|nr:YhbY family RNA-binding protein [Candidatus Bathyarchaeota archaeon]
GLTTQVLAEIDKQLEQKKMLKIRILTSAMQQDNAKTIAARVAEQTNAILVEVRGHIFMLYRRHKN